MVLAEDPPPLADEPLVDEPLALELEPLEVLLQADSATPTTPTTQSHTIGRQRRPRAAIA